MSIDRKVRGIRGPIPSGHVIGRLSPGDSDAELIPIRDLSYSVAASGAVSTPGSVIGLTPIADGDVVANISGSTKLPVATTLTALLDHVLNNTQGDIVYRDASTWKALAPGTSNQVLTTGGASANPAWTGLSTLLDNVFGNAQGDILYRDSSAWKALGPGTSGQFLQTLGSSHNPQWATVSAGSGTVTSVGLSMPADFSVANSPVTTSGTLTVTWANEADGTLLSNISGGSAAPSWNGLSAIIDHVLGSAQGDVLYRDSSAWKVLAPGTSGTFLMTQGASANPIWSTVSGASGGTGWVQRTIGASAGTLSIGGHTYTVYPITGSSVPGAGVQHAYAIACTQATSSTGDLAIIFRNSSGNGYRLVLQGDGNLVMYSFTSSLDTVIGAINSGGFGPITVMPGPHAFRWDVLDRNSTNTHFSASLDHEYAGINGRNRGDYDLTSGTWTVYVGTTPTAGTIDSFRELDLHANPYSQ